MDNFIARFLGKLLGRTLDCTLDCTITQMGFAEYALVASVFILVFVLTRKLLRWHSRSSKKRA